MWTLIKPYIFAQTIAIDRDGRVMIAGGIAVTIGGIATASATTAITAFYGLPAMLWFSGVGILLCPLLAGPSALFMRAQVVDRLVSPFRQEAAIPVQASGSTTSL